MSELWHHSCSTTSPCRMHRLRICPHPLTTTACSACRTILNLPWQLCTHSASGRINEARNPIQDVSPCRVEGGGQGLGASLVGRRHPRPARGTDSESPGVLSTTRTYHLRRLFTASPTLMRHRGGYHCTVRTRSPRRSRPRPILILTTYCW